MSLIKLNHVFLDRYGKAMKDDDENKSDLSLEAVAFSALTSLAPDEANLSREEKMKRGRLAQRLLAAHGEIDLKAEEITMLKNCIGKIFATWIVVQSEDMLDPVET